MTAHQENARMTVARQRKATALADTATKAGVTAEMVANDPDVRAALVVAAQVREPSLDTWRLVVSSLVAREGSPRSFVDDLVAEMTAVYADVCAGKHRPDPHRITASTPAYNPRRNHK